MVDLTTRSKKSDLRTRLRGILTEIDPAKWQTASEAASARLVEAITKRGAGGAGRGGTVKTVMFFMPTAKELDISPAAAACLKRGLSVCLPRIDWRRNLLTPAAVSSWGVAASQGEQLVETRHGIFEPPADAPTVDSGRLDLVVVPGLAFDARGGRLGKGGGFYDRFFGQPNVKAVRVGVGLDEQLVDEVPRDSWDVTLDFLVTPTRTMAFARDAGRTQHAGS
jgi:5-formyltetrahydrofolate cyclo-ligase